MAFLCNLKHPAVIPTKAGIQAVLNQGKTSVIAPLFALLFGALHMPSAYAGHADGQIAAVRSRASDGLVWINLTGPRVNKPACALYDYMMIKDENSETGKKQFAMLLQAHATGKPVFVRGTGDCSRWGDGESIEMVEILQ
ncbi:hypothetical protein EV696_101287 [Permianibacter aggregans]|uniref:Uncharacterized protein n=2 Tax=Permianibacter aggregans TaxID=1510150 RepID=A0A4R6UZ76_9GAMM|nr:hypothetical protein EV696_101287 [Permianibacter aggregans]